MTQILFIFSFPVLITIFPGSAQSLKSAEKDHVVVTVPEDPKVLKKNKKLRLYRPHLYEDQSGVTFRVTQTNKYPREIKKVRITYEEPGGPKETYRFSREAMFANMREGQAALVDELRSEGFTNIHKYEKTWERLDNNRTDPALRYQWHTLAQTRPVQPGEQVSLRIKSGFFKKVDFTTDTFRITTPRGFPAIDPEPCDLFDRFYARKQLRGYGIDKIKYDAYTLPKRKIVRQSFEVFFDKNQTTLRPEQVQPIIDYLKLNNLSILEIRIEGYSSIEGDSISNARLHHRRANRLIALLQRYNNEPIARDTVIVAEAWDDFRKAIRPSAFQWLDTLTNASIRQHVNTDESLRIALEPYFKPLRRGKISITLSDKFSTDDIIEKLFRDFNRTASELLTKRNSAKAMLPVEAKMLGMINYLDALVQSGHVSDDVLAELVDECVAAPEARILLFYHIVKTHEERRTQDADNTWDSLFVGRKWNNIFAVAHYNIMTLIEEARSTEARSRRLRQAEDEGRRTKYEWSCLNELERARNDLGGARGRGIASSFRRACLQDPVQGSNTNGPG